MSEHADLIIRHARLVNVRDRRMPVLAGLGLVRGDSMLRLAGTGVVQGGRVTLEESPMIVSACTGTVRAALYIEPASTRAMRAC